MRWNIPRNRKIYVAVLVADTLGIAIGLMAGRLIEGLQRQLAARRTQG